MSTAPGDPTNPRITRTLFYVYTILALIVGLLLSMLGDYLNTKFFHDTWLEFIGKFLEHGGAIIGVFAVFALASDRLTEIRVVKELSDDLATKIRRLVFEAFPGIQDGGLIAIRGEMPFRLLFEQLIHGDELFWLDTYAPGQKVWIDAIEAAASRGATMNFLVLCPDSALVELRATEIKGLFSYEKFKKELELFIDDLLETKQELDKRNIQAINVRQYTDLLACPIYLIKRNGKPYKAFSSFFLRKATGKGSFPHFEWAAQGKTPFINELDEYLTWKWSNAQPLPSYQIDCINKPDMQSPHERITHVGGPMPHGTGRWKASVPNVVGFIETKACCFYTGQDSSFMWVDVQTGAAGDKFLQTYADGGWTDNLLALKECL